MECPQSSIEQVELTETWRGEMTEETFAKRTTHVDERVDEFGLKIPRGKRQRVGCEGQDLQCIETVKVVIFVVGDGKTGWPQ